MTLLTDLCTFFKWWFYVVLFLFALHFIFSQLEKRLKKEKNFEPGEMNEALKLAEKNFFDSIERTDK